MTILLTGVLLAANGAQSGKGEEFGKSSPMALLVIVLLAIAVIFLVRSMTKHLKRVPASFDAEEQESGTDRQADPGPEAKPGQEAKPTDS